MKTLLKIPYLILLGVITVVCGLIILAIALSVASCLLIGFGIPVAIFCGIVFFIYGTWKTFVFCGDRIEMTIRKARK